MACPQCSRRLLAQFIQFNTSLTPVAQLRGSFVSKPLPRSYVRGIGNTQSPQFQRSKNNAGYDTMSGTTSSQADTVSDQESRSSLAYSTDPIGEDKSDLHDIKTVREKIRKELYKYLEAHSVDTKPLKPYLDNLPVVAESQANAEDNDVVPVEPDWRQIPRKHPRKKARTRYANDLARLTGQAPLYQETAPNVGSSVNDGLSLSQDRDSEAPQTSETDSHLTAPSGKGGVETELKTKARGKTQARTKLIMDLKASKKVYGGNYTQHTKKPEPAKTIARVRRTSQSGSYAIKKHFVRKENDIIRTQDHPKKGVKDNESSKPITVKSRSSEHPNKNKEHWQIDKAAIKEKIGGARWDPKKKLSPDAREGIRTLNAQYPDKFTTPVLAKHFDISSEAVRRILKSKWKPTAAEEEERQKRWDRRGEKIWTDLVSKGVKPPKRWSDMGIVRGQRDFQRRKTSSDYTNIREGNVPSLSGQSPSEWVASLPGRMR